MKKISVILVCVLLIALLALPGMAAAPDQVGGVEALGQAWNGYDGIPEYSGGYWIDDDGVLTVGLVDEAGKAEVLAIVGDAPVNFVMQTYSYNELMAVQNELTDYFEADVGMQTLGVYVMTNVVEVGIDMGNPGAGAFVEEMGLRYGDKVVFCDTDGLTLAATAGAATEEESSAEDEAVVDKDALLVMVIIGVAVVGFGLTGVLWLGRKKPMPPTHGFETKNFLDDQNKEKTEE